MRLPPQDPLARAQGVDGKVTPSRKPPGASRGITLIEALSASEGITLIEALSASEGITDTETSAAPLRSRERSR